MLVKILSNIVFVLALAGTAYFVVKKAKFDSPIPKIMVEAFLGIVFVAWIIQLF